MQRMGASSHQDHLKILFQGVSAWNKWRKENPRIIPGLFFVDLRGADLEGIDLNWTILGGTNLRRANLRGANLYGANLYKANLCETDLSYANLRWSNLDRAIFRNTNLTGANLEYARNAKLQDVVLKATRLPNGTLQTLEPEAFALNG